MKDKETIFDLEEQEILELLESIKKVHDQDKKLLTDNAFVYFRLGLNNPSVSPSNIKRVKTFPFPAANKTS